MRVLLLLALIAAAPVASPSDSTLRETAQAAFYDFQVEGEGQGHYSAFLARLADQENFEVFGHPSLKSGPLKGPAGLSAFRKLIAERTAKPNIHRAEHLVVLQNGRDVAFQYESRGRMNDGTPDDNENVVVLTISDDLRVVGFHEYTGRINSAWSKSK